MRPGVSLNLNTMTKSEITQIARQLRKQQTVEEYMLWQLLRNRRLKGVKFFRQHPIIYSSYGKNFQFFIPDFYSSEKKLVIELDGKIHDFQKEYDRNRDSILEDLGLKVIRFKNEELKDIKRVIDAIKSYF